MDIRKDNIIPVIFGSIFSMPIWITNIAAAHPFGDYMMKTASSLFLGGMGWLGALAMKYLISYLKCKFKK